MHLTVYFDGQFWVGLAEAGSGDTLRVFVHTFGEEPGDGILLDFVNHILPDLYLDSTGTSAEESGLRPKLNPKRLQKLARRALNQHPQSTKSQEVLQRQMELDKKEKKVLSRQQKLEQAEIRRMKAVEKARQKHRGH
ncbi:MAG: YjdF family protein [Bacteroidota bacterium]